MMYSAVIRDYGDESSFEIDETSPLPELKSFHICFEGETMKLGVFSFVKGLRPLKLAPVFFRAMKSEITSSTLENSKTLSIVSLLINLMYLMSI